TLRSYTVKAAPSRLMQRVLENGAADPPRLAHHRRKLRDDVERLPAADHLLQLGQLVLEPRGIDRRPRGAEDLRVRRWADRLAVVPQHLVQLLAGLRADELDRDVC